MRPVTHEVFGIPREHVIGSATALEYVTDERRGAIIRRPEADYLDDGPQKPIRIWSHVGRRPLLAAGNSNGDIPMLDFTRHRDKPFLPLLVLHDDAEREFDYTAGAEQALERGRDHLDGNQHQERLGRRLSGLDDWLATPRRTGLEPPDHRNARPKACTLATPDDQERLAAPPQPHRMIRGNVRPVRWLGTSS